MFQPKFNKEDLHRRPEFEDTKPPAPAAGPSTAVRTSAPSKPVTTVPPPRPASPSVKSEPTSRMEAILNACNATAQQGQNAPSVVPPQTSSASDLQGRIATSTPNVKTKPIPQNTSWNAANTSVSAAPSRGSGTVAYHNHQPQHTTKEASSSNGPSAVPPRQQQVEQKYGNPPPQEERRVSFAPQSVASTSTSAAQFVPPPAPAPVEVETEVDIPDDASEFLFNSDDDAFLAEVDLGEECLGGPIDFDEGASGLDVGEDSRGEALDPRQVGGPPPQEWGRPPQPPPRHAQYSTESRAAGPQPPPRDATASTSTSTSHRQQFTSAGSHIVHQSSRDTSSATVAQSPPTMGGFHYPPANSVRPPRSDLDSARGS